MDRENLIQSARALAAVDNQAIEELTAKRDIIADQMNKRMLARPDVEQLVGANNIAMMCDNHANHIKFVLSILRHPNAEVLVDTVLWVFRSYRSRGFHQNYWAAQLNTWLTIFRDALSPPTYEALLPLYNWLIVNIPHFTNLSDRQLEEMATKHAR